MPDPSKQTYFRAFPVLQGVYLEDSWVLDVSPSEDACAFHLEAVLTPDHPRYRSPHAGEQQCYAGATLLLTSASPISFHRSDMQPATDATGESDWGNIDTFEAVDWEGHHAWSLHGAWGELVIAEPAVCLVLAD